MPVVLFTCAGQRVDIVTAFGRAGATTLAVDLERARAGALRRRPPRARPARSTTPATSTALRALVAEHDVRRSSSRSPTSTIACSRRAATSSARSCCCPGPTTIALCEDKLRRAPLLRARRDRDAADAGCRTSCPTTSRFPVLVKARRGFGSRHIYRAADRARARLLPRLHDGRVDGAAGRAAARSSRSTSSATSTGRCLNAIPRTMIESKGGESIKGMTIKDAGADRARPPRRRGDRDRRAGEHPVLPRARRLAAGHRREPALRRRLPAADRGRVALPGARARARARRAARAAARRVPGGRRDDAVLLAGDPRADADGYAPLGEPSGDA